MSDPIRELFDNMDIDGDGVLNLDDLQAVMPEASDARLMEIIDKLNGGNDSGIITLPQFEVGFDEFTADPSGSNGDLSDGEYEDIDDEVDGEQGGSVKELFNSLDTDGDGALVVSDLRAILPDVEERSLAIIFKRLDTDSNGRVTFGEFLEGFEELLQFGRDHSGVGVMDGEKSSSARNRSATIMDMTNTFTFSDMKEHLEEENPVLARPIVEDERKRVLREKNKAAAESAAAATTSVKTTTADGTDGMQDIDENMAEEDITDPQTLHEIIRKLKAKSETYQRRYGLLSKVGRQLEDENLDLTNKLLETETNLRYARDELEDVKDSLVDYRKMVTLQQQKELSLKGKARSTEQTYEETMRQLELEQEQRKLLEEELNEMKEELASLKQVRSTDLRSKIRSRLMEVNQLAQQRRAVGETQLERKVKELTEENEMLREKVNRLEREIDSLHTLVADLQKEIDRLRSLLGGKGVSLAEQLQEDEKAKKQKSKAKKFLKRLNDHGSIKKMEANPTSHRQRSATTAFRPKFLTMPKKEKEKPDKVAQQFFQQFQKQRQKEEQSATKQLEKTKKLLTISSERNRELERRVEELEEQMAIQRRKEEEKKTQVQLNAEQQAEVTAYALYLNGCLTGDLDLKHILPIDTTNADLIYKIQDGWLPAKFLNFANEHTIDTRALNPVGTASEAAQLIENMTLVVESARATGAKLESGLEAKTLVASHENVQQSIDFISQIILTQLLQKVNVKDHPELVRLLGPQEEVGDLLKTSPEQMLVKWINFHVKESPKAALEALPKDIPVKFEVKDLKGDARIKDASALSLTLHRIFNARYSEKDITAVMGKSAGATRLEFLKERVERCGLPAYKQFLNGNVCAGSSESARRLTVAFVASVFNLRTGVELLTMEEIDNADLSLMEDDVGDSREERAFRLWINSMGLSDGDDKIHIHNLFSECKDGLLLLRIMDRIQPGSVNWKKVEMKPNNKFKKVSNCNEVIHVGKEEFKFSLVGIGGPDLVDGNKKLTLSVVWQLMHRHITGFLTEVHMKKFGKKHNRRTSLIGGSFKRDEGDSDSMIIDWANRRLVELDDNLQVYEAQLKGTAYDYPFELMKSFHDSRLSDSLYLIHLIWSVSPRIVNWDLVTKGVASDDKILNARYAISCARKLGATIFLLPEDIVEVKPKMITSFVSSILSMESFKHV